MSVFGGPGAGETTPGAEHYASRDWSEVPKRIDSYLTRSEPEQREWWSWVPEDVRDVLTSHLAYASGDTDSAFPEETASIVIPWMARRHGKDPEGAVRMAAERLAGIVQSASEERGVVLDRNRNDVTDATIVAEVWARVWSRVHKNGERMDSSYNIVLDRMWYALGTDLESVEHWENRATVRAKDRQRDDEIATERSTERGVDDSDDQREDSPRAETGPIDTHRPHYGAEDPALASFGHFLPDRDRDSYDGQASAICDVLRGDLPFIENPFAVDLDALDAPEPWLGTRSPMRGEILAEVAWALLHDPDRVPTRLEDGSVEEMPIETRMKLERAALAFGISKSREEWIHMVAQAVQANAALTRAWKRLCKELPAEADAHRVLEPVDIDPAGIEAIANYYAEDLARVAGSGDAPVDLTVVDYAQDRDAVRAVLYLWAQAYSPNGWTDPVRVTLARYELGVQPPPSGNTLRQQMLRLKKANHWLRLALDEIAEGRIPWE